MQKHTRSHRHFIALPAFGVLVVVSLLSALQTVGEQSQAQLISITEGHEVLALPSGLHGRLDEGEVEVIGSDVYLKKGALLIESEGLIRLHVGDRKLLGFGGAFHVSLYGDGLSVAALSTPVVVIDGEERVIVPALRQWRTQVTDPLPGIESGYASWADARSVQFMPQRFLHTQFEYLTSLPGGDSTILPSPRSTFPVRPSLSLMRLSAAEERTESEFSEEVLRFLVSRVHERDTQAVSSLFSDESLQSIFTSDRGVQILMSLMLEGKDDVIMAPLLLERAVRNTDIHLLLSLHPSFATQDWLLGTDELSEEARLVRLFIFPQGDVLADSFSDLAFDRWTHDVSALFQSRSHSFSLLGEMIDVWGLLAGNLENRGYPERSRRLADAILEIASPFSHQLSTSQQDILNNLSLLERVDIISEGEGSHPDTSEEQLEEIPDPLRLQAIAEQILSESGILFTVESSVKAYSPGIVHVTSVLVAGKNEDRLVDFSFDVESRSVRDVVLNDRRLPYGLSLEEFIRWMNG
jgi:hypothetical protein